jgi:hypothetical protein
MQYRALFVFGLLVALVLSISNCSVIGLGIGAISDSRKPDTLAISGCEIKTIKPGTKIKVVVHEGEPVRGGFVSLDAVSPDEYVQIYSRFREENRVTFPMPTLGDSVDITLKDGLQGWRRFAGFDYDYVSKKLKHKELPISPATNSAIIVNRWADTTSGKVLVSQVQNVIDVHGNAIKGEILEELASEGELPFMSALLLKNPDGTQQVAMNSVAQIELKNKKNDKWQFLAIGAIIDVFLFLMIYNLDMEFDLSGVNLIPY